MVISLNFPAWPAADREAWAAACRPKQGLRRGGRAVHLKDITRRDLARRYGYFLTYLRDKGELDLCAAAAAQVTPEAVEGYLERAPRLLTRRTRHHGHHAADDRAGAQPTRLPALRRHHGPPPRRTRAEPRKRAAPARRPRRNRDLQSRLIARGRTALQPHRRSTGRRTGLSIRPTGPVRSKAPFSAANQTQTSRLLGADTN
jgi:hypothetical protein